MATIHIVNWLCKESINAPQSFVYAPFIKVFPHRTFMLCGNTSMFYIKIKFHYIKIIIGCLYKPIRNSLDMGLNTYYTSSMCKIFSYGIMVTCKIHCSNEIM